MSVDTVALQAAKDKGLTVGVIPTDGSQALRLEIDDFLADADLANLYFLALEAFMKDDISSQPFSYYEISGIHGQPYRAWDRAVMLMDWMKMDIQLYPIHLHPPKIHFHPPNGSWIST
jgi:hypothetical protein